MEIGTLRVEHSEKVPPIRPVTDVALDVVCINRQDGEAFTHVYHGCRSYEIYANGTKLFLVIFDDGKLLTSLLEQT